MFKVNKLLIVLLCIASNQSFSVSPGAHKYYEVLVNQGYTKADIVLKEESKATTSLCILKEAREFSKIKKDCESVQFLTEKIIDAKKNILVRNPKLTIAGSVITAAVLLLIGFRGGKYFEASQVFPGDN